MLGLVRTIFALMVMAYHLLFGRAPLGFYPVFGFYIISGYLMTLIMHESYGYTWKGRYSFAVNRFLRLYPQYWTAAAISLFSLSFFWVGLSLIFLDEVNKFREILRILEAYIMLIRIPKWSGLHFTARIKVVNIMESRFHQANWSKMVQVMVNDRRYAELVEAVCP